MSDAMSLSGETLEVAVAGVVPEPPGSQSKEEQATCSDGRSSITSTTTGRDGIGLAIDPTTLAASASPFYKDLTLQSIVDSMDFTMSTPLDRFSDVASNPHLASRPIQRSKDQPPTCPPALKDRSNESPYNTGSGGYKDRKLSAASSARPKRFLQATTTPLARFSLDGEDFDGGSNEPKNRALSSKRRKKSTPVGDTRLSERRRRKSLPVLSVAAASSVQLVRSSAHFFGSTLQSAFGGSSLSKTHVSDRKHASHRSSMSPQKRKLPTADNVAEIRRLVHEYTRLDPLDRQDSTQSQLIRAKTGYMLNPPLVSLLGSVPARSPIHTRSGKLQVLQKLRIDLSEMDACKNRDQQLAETCTQCRYERDGYKYRFVYIPSGATISAEQFEARYLVMLQQVCASRSEYWLKYFGKLYGTTLAAPSLVMLGANKEEEDVRGEDDGEEAVVAEHGVSLCSNHEVPQDSKAFLQALVASDVNDSHEFLDDSAFLPKSSAFVLLQETRPMLDGTVVEETIAGKGDVAPSVDDTDEFSDDLAFLPNTSPFVLLQETQPMVNGMVKEMISDKGDVALSAVDTESFINASSLATGQLVFSTVPDALSKLGGGK